MKDYTTMSDDDLRRAIAEALGYKVVRDYELYNPGGTEYVDALLDPNGKIVGRAQRFIETKRTEWGAQQGYWVPDEQEAFRYLPDWPRDLNAAVTLPIDDEMAWYIQPQHEYVSLTRPTWSGDNDDEHVAHGKGAPARAACLAWLAWRKGQER